MKAVRLSCLVAVVVLGVVGGFASSALAGSYAWNYAGSGGWGTTTYWTPNGTPGAADTVTVSVTGATVSLGGVRTVTSFVLGSNDTLWDGTLIATSIENSGYGAYGSIRLLGGTVNANLVSAGDLAAWGGISVLNGESNYAGMTYIAGAGVLQGTEGVNVMSTTNMQFGDAQSGSAGTFQTSQGTFTRSIGTGPGQVNLIYGGFGFAAIGNDLIVSMGGLGTPTTISNFPYSTYALRFGSTTADHMVDFRNPLSFTSSTAYINVADNTATNADYVMFSGLLSGSGSPNKQGTGTLELTAANTYTGTTTIAGGVLRAVDGVGLPTNSCLILGGGVYETSGTFSRALGTTGNTVKWSSSGGFSAKGGSLTVNIGGAGAALTWASTTNFIGAATLIFGSSSADDVVEFVNPINLNNAVRTIQVNDNADTGADLAKLSGVISSSTPASGGLTKTGAGTLWLSNTNTYTGTTTISGGALRATQGVGLHNSSFLVLGGGVLETSGTFSRSLGTSGSTVQWTTGGGGFAAQGGTLAVNIGGSSVTMTWGGASFVPTGSPLILNSVTADNAVDFQNPIDLGNVVRTIQVNDNPDTAADYAKLSGHITGVAGSGLTKTGLGTLKLASTNQLDNNIVLTVNGGTLDLNGFSQSLGTVVTLTDGTITGGTLTTTDSSAASFTLSNGAISANIVSSGGITKTGTGTVILSGANNYAGVTTISGGTLQGVQGAAGVGSIMSNKNMVLAGGVFQTASGSFTRTLGAGATAVQWTASGGFAAVTNPLSVNLGGALGTMTWNAGSFVPTGSALILGSTTATSYVDFRNPIELGTAVRTIQVDDNPGTSADYAKLSGAITTGAGGGLLKTGTGTLKLGATNQIASGATLTVNGGTLDLNGFGQSLSTVITLTDGTITGGTLITTDATAGSITVSSGTFSADFVSSGGLTKSTTGTVTLSGSNTYSGATAVAAGSLVVTNAGALGTTSAVTVTTGATLALQGTGMTVAQPISLNGAGTVNYGSLRNMTGTNTWSGVITLGAAAAIGADAGSTLILGSSAMSGAFALTKVGGGTLQLGVANQLTGAALLAYAGTLDLYGFNQTATAVSLGDANGVGSAGAITSSIGSATLTGTGYLVYNGAIGVNLGSNAAALTKSTTGTVTLSGNNAYTGATTVSAGTLVAASNTALGTAAGTTSVTSGATLAIQGSGLTVAESVTINGTGVSNLGALRNLANTNTWSGNITLASDSYLGVDAGSTLILASSGSLTGNYKLTKVGSGTLDLGAAGVRTVGSFWATGGSVTNGTITATSTENSGFSQTGSILLQNVTVSANLVSSGSLTAWGGVSVVTGSNNYAGMTFIGGGGVLQGVEGVGIMTTTKIQLGDSQSGTAGVFQTSQGTFTRTYGSGAGQVAWAASGGFAAIDNDLIVSIGGMDSPTALGWVPGWYSYALTFGSATADHMVEFRNPVYLQYGSGSYFSIIQVNDNPATNADYAKMTGVLTGNWLNKTGAGTLELTAANTFTQAKISAGVLRAAEGVGLPGAAWLVLAGGVYETSGTFSRALGTSGATVQWSGSGGFSAKGGSLTVNIGGAGAALTWASTTNFIGAATLIFGSSSADNVVDFQNPINLNNAVRTVQVDDNPNTGADVAKLSGVISSTTASSGGITKTGAGTLWLTAANTYTGTTTISGGAIRAAIGTGIHNSSFLVLSGGVLETSGTFSRALGTSGGAVQWGASGGGFAAYGGTLAVNIGGSGDTLVWGSTANFIPTGGALILGSGSADSVVDFQNPLDLNNGVRTIQVNDNPDTAADYARLSGAITSTGGGGGLTKTGLGTLKLTATNQIASSVALTVNGGTFDLNTFNQSLSTVITLIDGTITGGTLTTSDATAGSVTVQNGVISADLVSSGGVTKTGTGLVILSGTNSYTGATTISAGVLQGTEGVGIMSTTNMIMAGGVFQTGSGSFTRALGAGATNVQWTATGGFAAITNPLAVNLGGASAAVTWDSGSFVPTGAALILGSASATSYVDFQNPIELGTAVRTIQVDDNSATAADYAKLSGAITTGAGGGLMKTGAGTLKLTSINQIAAGASLSVSGGMFDLNTFNQTLNTTVTLIDGTITGATITGANYVVYNGTISAYLGSNAATMTKSTPGTVTLSGNNQYAGATSVTSGTLIAASGTALGTSGGNTSVTSGASLAIQGSGLSIAEAITLNGVGFANYGALRNMANTNTWTGAITLGSAASIGTDAGSTLIVGPTAISGAYALTKVGTGTLQLGMANQVPNAPLLISGGTLDMYGFNQRATAVTLGDGLGTAGNIVSSNGTVTLTGTSYTVNKGTISVNLASNNATMTKNTADTVTLSGNNAYTGATTVAAGILAAASNTALGTTAGTTSVTSGATLGIQGGSGLTIAESITINGTGVSNLGALRNLANTNTWTGNVLLASDSYLGVDAGSTLVLAASGSLTGNFKLTKVGAGTLDLGGGGTRTVTSFWVSGGVVTNGTITATSTENSGFSQAGSIMLLGATVSASLVSNGDLAVWGGTNIVTGSNTYLGMTFIAGGGVLQGVEGTNIMTNTKLQLGDSQSGTSGVFQTSQGTFTRSYGSGAGQVGWSAGGGFAAITNDLIVSIGGMGTPTALAWVPGYYSYALTFGSATADHMVEFRNPVYLQYGSGSYYSIIQVNDNPNTTADYAKMTGVLTGNWLNKTGAGTLELTAANTYTQARISTGVLRAAEGVGLPGAAWLVLAGGVFETNGTFNRALGTSGATVQWSTSGGFSAKGGALTVNIGGAGAALTWGSTTNFVSGTLIFGSTSADSAVEFQNPINLNNAVRTVQVDDNPATSGDYARLSGVISNGSLTKTGAGTLWLSATNTYTGTTTISGGALRATQGVGLNNNSFLVLSGGVLETSGTFSRALGTSGGTVQWTTGGGGFAAQGGTLNVNIGGALATLAWGGTNFIPTGSPLILGSGTADNVVDFQNPLDLNSGVRTIQVNDNPDTAADYAKLSGAITSTGGGGGLTKTGLGTLKLTAANQIASSIALTVNGGTLDLDGYNQSFSTVITLIDGTITGGTLTTSDASAGSVTVSNGTFSANFTSPGGLSKTESGTVVLSGANSYAGATFIGGGVLQGVEGAAGVASVMSNTNMNLAGGVFQTSGGSFTRALGTGGADVQWTASGGFAAVASDLAVNIGGASGTMTWGSGSFVPAGGTLILGSTTADHVVDFQNPIELGSLAGTIQVDDNPATAADYARLSGAVTGTGSLAKTGLGTLKLVSANQIAGTISLSVFAGTLDLDGNDQAVTGVILGDTAGSAGTIAGATLTASTSYVVNSGTISADLGSSSAPLTKNTPGTVLLSGSNAYSGATSITAGTLIVTSAAALGSTSGIGITNGTLALDGGSGMTVAKPITLNGAGSALLGALRSMSGTNTWTGSIALGSASSIGVDADTLILGSSPMSGAFALTKVGAGILQLGVGNQIPNSGLNVSAGTLDLYGFNQAAAAVTLGSGYGSDGTIASSSGTATLTGTSYTVNKGAISVNLGSNTATMTKNTADTVTLSGSNNYSGATTVAAGTLVAASDTALGTVGGTTSVTSGATLAIHGSSGLTIGELITLNGAGVSNLGALRSMANTNTWSGNITLGSASTIGVDADTLILDSTCSISGAFALTKVGDGTLQFGKVNQIASGASITVNGGTLDLHNFGQYMTTTFTLTNGIVLGGGSSGTLNVSAYAASNGRFDVNLYGGSGGLAKSTTGTVILTGDNMYTGATTVSAGTLTTESSMGLGATSGVSVTSGATLGVDGDGLGISRTITLNGTGVSNLGALRNMSGTNTWTGAITLGTSGASIGVDSGSTLIMGSSAMGGAYALTKVGGGTLQLGVTNQIPLNATLTVNGGTLDLNGFSQNVGNTVITLTDGIITGTTPSHGGGYLSTSNGTAASITVSNGTFAADFYSTAGGGLTKTTAGTVVLTGRGSYTGATIISGGVLQGTEGTGFPNIMPGTNMNLNGGVFQTDNGTFTRGLGTWGGTVQWGSDGGFSAVTNDLAVSLGGIGTPAALSWGVTTCFVATGKSLILSSTTATRIIDFQNPINLGTAARMVQVDDNPAVNTDGAKLSGLISSGAGGGLTKTGSGLLELSAENTYSGGTTVSAGTLKVSGTIGAVLVKAGARLAGDGQVGSVIVGELGGDPGAIVAPGNSPGTLDVVGDYTMNNGSIYEWELASLLSYDKIAVTGDLTLNSTWTLKIINDGFVPGYISPSEQFDLFTYVGSLSSTFDPGDDHKLMSVNIVIGSGLDPDIWNIGDAEVRYDTSGPAKRVYLTGLQVGSGGSGAVPEPAALGLIGLLLLAVTRRRTASRR